MDEFSNELNQMIVDLYRYILLSEEQLITRSKKLRLSINEMHMIESIAKEDNSPKTISYIADDLGITLPSVTVAINKLIKKGYVVKNKSETDGRMIFASLTREGSKVDRLHRTFHKKVVGYITQDLTANEKKTMLSVITRLNVFFNQLNRETREQ